MWKNWRDKRGSLEISIQAIVILVMAMAVLGLGLGFIRTLIGKGQAQFEDAIGAVELDNPPTAADPFTADAKINVKGTGEGQFRAGVYNDGTFTEGEPVSLMLGGCIPELELNNEGEPTLAVRSISQTISEGGYGGYKAIVTSDGTDTGTYICELIAETSDYERKVKQITINVNS